ncbi:MAG: hypothetical protein KC495_08635 [Dehalococcoidia bacterium]|nr:hypothetical protein [Dehalococcoidia bacterium]MCB9486417.1 hypothetical protein [Thermoflexaceae bacterium]
MTVVVASAAATASPSLRVALLAAPVLAVGPYAGYKYPGYTAAFVVFLAALRRPLTEAGVPLADYAHYVPVLLSLAALGRPSLPGTHRRLLLAGLLGISAITFASATGNEWHALIPGILIITYVQPFLVLYLAASASEVEKRVLVIALVALAGLQLPFVAAQLATHGPSDYVVGFLGSGNAHTLGGIALVATVLAAVHASQRVLRFGLVATFISVAVAADAKQMLAALAIAAIPVSILALGRGSARMLPLAAAVVLAMYIGRDVAPLFDQLGDPERAREYAEQKKEGFQVVLDRLDGRQLLLGLGPGDGFSRVSSATVPGYGRVPGSVFGGHVSELAAEYQLYYAARHGQISSAGSVYSSWAGVLSEVGLMGLLSFAALTLWAFLTTRSGQREADLTTLLLLTWWAILGLVFTWMEEPVFSTFLMAAAGATTIRHGRPALHLPNESEHSPLPQPP